MADEEKKGSVMSDVWWLVGALTVLVVLWYLAGGPGKADLRGLFLAPPQPLGTGGAYGPQPGSNAETPPADTQGSQGYYSNQ